MPRRTPSPLLPLQDAPREGIGPKADNLARLLRAGLPVPRAWVLPARAHREAIRAAGLQDALNRGDHAAVAEALLVAPLGFAPPVLAERLAVRSSANDEDTRGSAAAGTYATVLDVPPDGVADAIRRVWASWHLARARSPTAVDLASEAPSDADVGMAVLLVEMVEPRCAGVAFTVNPLTGSWAEMVVEACWGLGEALVSGKVAPDRYVVRRPRGVLARQLPEVLLERALAWASETIAPQTHELRRAPAGGTERVPCEAPGARKLAREDVLALCRVALRVERLAAAPQDIEWAQLHDGSFVLLQTRPITTRAEPPRGGSTLWTRRFLGERFPDGATPLGWSLLEPVLTHFVGYPQTGTRFLGGDPPFRRLNGHPYVNVTVFRHLAFKLPGTPPPRFMLDLLPPDEEARWVGALAAAPDLRVYASLLGETFRERRWSRFRWNPVTNPAAWDAFVTALDAALPTLQALPPEEALAAAKPWLHRYVGIHVTSLLFANLAYEALAPQLGPDADVLLQPPSGSITARVNDALRDLGRTPDTTLSARLEGFLAAHGHRARASWEVWSPRWAETPDAVLALARAMGDRPHAPADEVAIGAKIAALPAGLRGATELARTYLRLREEQRYHLDRLLWWLKQQLRRLGARWFADADDIRWLQVDEVEAALAGSLAPSRLAEIVARRRAEPRDARPSEFLSGDEALRAATASLSRLQGLGIAPGFVRGRVRVLAGPEDAHRLRPGEILVTRVTDPGWTPLFHRAGGLVLEMGSQLSHGAIVARELRLPAVANIADATTLLRDGEEVALDGRSGVLWRAEDAS